MDVVSPKQAKIAERNKLIAELDADIANYQGKIGETSAQAKTLKNAIASIDLEIKKLQTQITSTQTKISKTDLTIQSSANTISDREKRIDKDRSAHRMQYEAMIGRLEGQHGPLPFTLPPEAVLKRVVHALESPRPHRRYQVTVPAYLTAWLRRLLPTPLLDWLLYRIGGEGWR